MNSNKLFSYVIDLEIIQHLINYLLIESINNNNNNNINNNNNNNNNSDINGYSIKRFYNNLNEILIYSLVSKKWYDSISRLISKNIENNNIIEYWFDRYKPGPLLRFNFNKKYSIIKIDDNIIKEYFNKILVLEDSHFYNTSTSSYHNNYESKYRKIIVNFYKNQGIKKLFKASFKDDNGNSSSSGSSSSSSSSISSNYSNIFNSNKTELNNISLCFDEKGSRKLLSIFGNKDIGVHEIKYIKTNRLIITNADYDGELMNILKYFQTKHIEYDPNGDYFQGRYPHINYSNLFSKESIGDRIESITIENTDHVEPIDLFNVNQFSNLHTISIPLLIHVIIKGSGKKSGYCENFCDYHYGDLERTNDILKEWNQMIDSLITSKSLRNITMKNFCSRTNCLKKEFDCFNISSSIKRLLLNQTTTATTSSSTIDNSGSVGIQYLKLFNFKFKLFSSMLRENDGFGDYKSTIKTLELENNYLYEYNNEPIDYLEKDLIYLFSNILTLNNFYSIKHLILNFYTSTLLSIIIEQLTKNINHLNLYSITLCIDQNKLNSILDFVKLILSTSSLSSITLKEINLIIEEDINGKDIEVDKNLKEKLKDFYKYNIYKFNHSIIINIL